MVFILNMNMDSINSDGFNIYVQVLAWCICVGEAWWISGLDQAMAFGSTVSKSLLNNSEPSYIIKNSDFPTQSFCGIKNNYLLYKV
jgi:hypothetical protein